MPFSEFENKKHEKIIKDFIATRNQRHFEVEKLNLTYKIDGYAVEIIEIKQRWNKPSETFERPIARAKYIQKSDLWKIYWQRADLKWQSFPRFPEVKTFEEFINILSENDTGHFWG